MLDSREQTIIMHKKNFYHLEKSLIYGAYMNDSYAIKSSIHPLIILTNAKSIVKYQLLNCNEC